MNKEELWEYQKKVLLQSLNAKDVIVTPDGYFHVQKANENVLVR